MKKILGKNKWPDRKTTAWVSGVALVILMIGVGYTLFSSPEKDQSHQDNNNQDQTSSEPEKKEETVSCPDCIPSKFNGIPVPPEQANPYPIAIMFDNHNDARPPAGLAEADLVYETEAEGGITRYLAVFANNKEIKKIGPVRSARPYFLDWVEGLSALFVHCGGSPAALAQLTHRGIYDLDEFYNSGYFRRDPSRPRPHNIFTSSESLNNYLQTLGLETGGYNPWKFKPGAPLEKREESQGITIPFDPGYEVKWEYDREKNHYLRYLDGQVHSDTENKRITASNIIIQFTSLRIIDKELRLKLEATGEGEALICRDGKCLEGEWRKPSADTRTKYYTPDNKEVKFNPGTTWIEVVRSSFREKIKE